MKNLDEIIPRLRDLKSIIISRYRVKEIGIFGSFARQEQDSRSDIDLLVEFEETADLFDMIGLNQFLEEAMQCHVDIVPKRALRAELQESVLQEVVSL